jgi:hypothetical protein
MRFRLNNTIETKKFSYAARPNAGKFCHCPLSEPGKINLDPCRHQPGYWIRKRLVTKDYTVNTSVTLEKFTDGYALGVAV